MRIACLALALLLLAPIATAADSSEVAWRFSDSALAPPAVHEMLVFTGSEDGRVFALYAHSGGVRWSRDVGARVFGLSASGGRVFVSSSRGVLCLSADNGNLLWEFEVVDLIHRAPLVENSAIFVLSHSGRVISLDFNGNLLWQKDLGETIMIGPTAASERNLCAGAPELTIAVATVEGEILLLDARSGSLWKEVSTGPRYPATSDFEITSGKIYLRSGDHLLAVSLCSGEILWIKNLGCTTPPTVGGNVVYVGTSSGLVALSREDGEILWSRMVDGGILSLTADDGGLIAGTADGVIRFDLDGNRLWRSEIGSVVYPPVPAYGKIFALAASREIVCIGDWGKAGDAGKGRGYLYFAVALVSGALLILLSVLAPPERKVRRRRVKRRKRSRRA